MGLLSIIRRRPPVEQRNLDAIPFSELTPSLLFGDLLNTTAGVVVTPENALTASAVLACVGRIARDIATLPIHIIDRDNGKRVSDHPVARVLRSPNEYQTPTSFWSGYVANLLLWGNGFAAAEFTGDQPSAILPMLSKQTRLGRRDGELYYLPSRGGHALRADQVLHTPYLPLDGINGQSPIQLAAKTIGVSIALNDFVARFFAQGSHLDQNAFELPPCSAEALTELRRQLAEQFSGPDSQHKRLALPGLKVHRLADNLRNSQAIEARQFQLREICRVFSMPIGIIDPEASTYGNLEQQYRSYSQACLRPHVVAIEQELNRKLFSTADQDRYAVRWNLDAVVRATLADRMTADATGVQAGILTPNEARAHHDLPPVEGGDRLLSPLNMAPADQRSTPQATDPPTEARDDERLLKLVGSVASSIAVKELNAIRSAAKKHDDFAAWAAEFFDKHAEHIEERLAFINTEQAKAIAEEARDELLAAHRDNNLEQFFLSWVEKRSTSISERIATHSTGSPCSKPAA